jgi:hypothetical protein
MLAATKPPRPGFTARRRESTAWLSVANNQKEETGGDISRLSFSDTATGGAKQDQRFHQFVETDNR